MGRIAVDAAEAERDRLVAEGRRALTAAAEERGRLLQRPEAAEAQIAVVTAARASAPANDKPSRARATRSAAREGSAIWPFLHGAPALRRCGDRR
jgi:hypothetical protein